MSFFITHHEKMFDLYTGFIYLYPQGYTKPSPVKSSHKWQKDLRSPLENAAVAEGFRKRAYRVEQGVLSTGNSICKGSRQWPSLDSLVLQFV